MATAMTPYAATGPAARVIDSMGTFIDMTGHQFGRLHAIGRAPNKSGNTMWECQCECGKCVTVAAGHLRSGHTVSCGCHRAELTVERNRASSTHGMTAAPVYSAWVAMKMRCTWEGHPRDWPNYGGRGITVCPEWVTSFEAFYAYIGDHPGSEYSLDRIDVDGNYEPGNVRWATASEQATNRRLRTYCDRGHLFDEANTCHPLGNPRHKKCRKCHATKARQYRRRQRGES